MSNPTDRMIKCIEMTKKKPACSIVHAFLSPVGDHFSFYLGPGQYRSVLRKHRGAVKKPSGQTSTSIRSIYTHMHAHTPAVSVWCRAARHSGSRPRVGRQAGPEPPLQSNGPPPPPGSPATVSGCAPAGPRPTGPAVTLRPLLCCSATHTARH